MTRKTICMYVHRDIKCEPTMHGAVIVIKEKVKKGHTALEDITLRHAKPVQAGIYVHKAKPMEDILIEVNMQRWLKQMRKG